MNSELRMRLFFYDLLRKLPVREIEKIFFMELKPAEEQNLPESYIFQNRDRERLAARYTDMLRTGRYWVP